MYVKIALNVGAEVPFSRTIVAVVSFKPLVNIVLENVVNLAISTKINLNFDRRRPVSIIIPNLIICGGEGWCQ
jgi:hypothetical protein